MRNSKVATEAEKTQFALKAWVEADNLEQGLNRHACVVERAFIFHALEYLFKWVLITSQCIHTEFMVFLAFACIFPVGSSDPFLLSLRTLSFFYSGIVFNFPFLHSDVSGLHRNKAEEWCKYSTFVFVYWVYGPHFLQ